MPIRPGLRRWIYAWLLLIAPVWALGLRDSAALLRWARSAPDMCQDLPDYGAAARLLPARGPVGFFTEVPDPGSAERFFCAQYGLAPRVLVRWRKEFVNLDKRQLAGTTLLLHFSDPAARETFVRDLTAEAQRQGDAVTRRDASGGLTVVTVERGGRG